MADLVSALLNLGYKAAAGGEGRGAAPESGSGAEAAFQALFREALKVLRSGA